MEPEGSSLFSQDPATCAYPEPDESCPRPLSYVFIEYYPPIYSSVGIDIFKIETAKIIQSHLMIEES
jgi:hypothetical protein